MELLVLLIRFAGDALALILLLDFFSQPFRFYGMDPVMRFVYSAARRVCAPFEALSRRIIQVPDRDLTPLFVLVLVVFARGVMYAASAAVVRHEFSVLVLGITLSFLELFVRVMIPGLLFLVYLDIQLAPHQGTFVGNPLVMLLHDITKRFIVMIRKLLPSYQPVAVFVSVFFLLGVLHWILVMVTLAPFHGSGDLNAFPIILWPVGSGQVGVPFLLLAVVLIQIANTFLFGIFLLILMQMIAGLSGLDPYDRTALLLGISISPWVNLAHRWFPFARIGMFDFSIAILLLILWFGLGILTQIVTRISGS